jgi:hypothetical protein
MKSSGLWQTALWHRLRHYPVPLIAILVAVMQCLAASKAGLSPWKGGGFGMFSTLDSPPNRALAILGYSKEHGTVRIVPAQAETGSLARRAIARVKTLPTRSRLESLAAAVLAKPVALEALEPMSSALAGSTYGSGLRQLRSQKIALAGLESQFPAGAQRVQLESVTLIVLRPRFDLAKGELRLARLAMVSVRR